MVMLRRVGGFVANVIRNGSNVANVIRTANPFMSPSSKTAPADAADDPPGEPRGGTRTGTATGTRKRRRRRRKTKEKERGGDGEMMKENEADVVAESEPTKAAGPASRSPRTRPSATRG